MYSVDGDTCISIHSKLYELHKYVQHTHVQQLPIPITNITITFILYNRITNFTQNTCHICHHVYSHLLVFFLVQ